MGGAEDQVIAVGGQPAGEWTVDRQRQIPGGSGGDDVSDAREGDETVQQVIAVLPFAGYPEIEVDLGGGCPGDDAAQRAPR